MTTPPQSPDPDARLQQAFSSYMDALEQGRAPARAEYLARFPECAGELAVMIDAHRRLSELFSPFRSASTEDFRKTAPPAGAPKVVRLALPPGLSGATEEVRELLRQRLRLVAVLLAVGLSLARGIGLAFAAPTLLLDPLTAYYGFAALVVCLEVAAIVLLSPGRQWSLGRLRALEWLVFAPPAVAIICSDGLELAALAPSLEPVSAMMLASAKSVSWVLCMVGYGVLIPNTWRRCAAAIGLLALLGFVPELVVLVGNGVPAGALAVYLANKGLWLGLAAAIVIYGAHRLEVLGSQAAAARQLGQYRLEHRLDTGGMGEVYLAHHARLRRPCAIKLIRADRAHDQATLQRFEREVQTTAELTHPNTVQIYDYGHAEDGTFYYVMEYLPGLTLAQLVARHGPLEPARAVRLLRQVCGALAEAHAVGLTHRDIKPGNVMVCERGGQADVAKLLDFGLVRVERGTGAPGLTGEHSVAGTPDYMAPEQAAGLDHLDGRADIYALGAVAYFLLTGRPPFAGSVGQVLAAHQYEPPAPLSKYRPDVPADLEAVVLRCLAKDPAARFPDARALDAALAACPSERS